MSPQTELQDKRFAEGDSQITDRSNAPIHEALQEFEDKLNHYKMNEKRDDRTDDELSEVSEISGCSRGHEVNGILREPEPLKPIQTSYSKHTTMDEPITSELNIDLNIVNLKMPEKNVNTFYQSSSNYKSYTSNGDKINKNQTSFGQEESDPSLVRQISDEEDRKENKHEDFTDGNDGCGDDHSHESDGHSVESSHFSEVENDEDELDSRKNYPTHTGAPDSKYRQYKVLVDPKQDDRAVEIALCSISRPHMRAFHCAWTSFFVAFLCWFAIAPLLSEVTISLNLTKQQIWTSNMFSVTGSAILRIVIGPLCDKYGARLCSAGILFVTAVPTMALGLSQDFATFCSLRLLIGMAGATFVTGQYWTSSMFTREVAGTANALVAGWGNLGGGITQILAGSILFPFFKWMYKKRGEASEVISDVVGDEGARNLLVNRILYRPEDRAWRSVPVLPGLIGLFTAYIYYSISDDSPKGNYHKRKKQGFIHDVKVWDALRDGLKDTNTWVLFLQYGCCFGVELTVSNAAALYFQDVFGQSVESAAAIASIFGWMNIFARGLGGFMSDMCNAWDGMRGRIAWQTCCLLCEGLSTILFVYSKTLVTSILTLALFSFFVQATEGSTFGIVPYVNPKITGSIVGVVGAGGNVGGICFSLLFREYSYERAFTTMGWCVVGSSLLSFFILIQGHAGLTCGKDAPEVRTALRRRNRRHYDENDDIALSEVSSEGSNESIHQEQRNTKRRGLPDLSGGSFVISLKNNFNPFREYAFDTRSQISKSDSSISSHSEEETENDGKG